MKKNLELTPKQAQFVNIFIEKGLQQSAKQCAIDAGYGENVATVVASKLQNPKYYPHVVQEIERRRAELNRRYSISYKSHIQKQNYEIMRKLLVTTLVLLLPRNIEAWWLDCILTVKKLCTGLSIKCQWER